MLNTKINIGVCSTTHGVSCVQALFERPEFNIAWVITPRPRPVGRAQTLTPSPMESWAREKKIEVKHVDKKMAEIQDEVLASHNANPIDVLLVIDFGFLIPQWLLDLPRIGPVNVHPSDLPKYRGGSPAQYALLAGESETAVCIMRLIWELDAGPIIRRLPFTIPSTMTQTQYYDHAFDLAQAALPDTLLEYAETRQETPQPPDSPTPIASRLSRQDGFVQNVIFDGALDLSGAIFPDLIQRVTAHQTLTPAQKLDRMVRALSPWPGVWTEVPEYKGRKNVRLKLLSGALSQDQQNYTLTQWQYEGEKIQEK